MGCCTSLPASKLAASKGAGKGPAGSAAAPPVSVAADRLPVSQSAATQLRTLIAISVGVFVACRLLAVANCVTARATAATTSPMARLQVVEPAAAAAAPPLTSGASVPPLSWRHPAWAQHSSPPLPQRPSLQEPSLSLELQRAGGIDAQAPLRHVRHPSLPRAVGKLLTRSEAGVLIQSLTVSHSPPFARLLHSG